MTRHRTIRKHGITWTCATPGVRWTAHKGGWYLFLTDGPSWYLMGNNVEIDLGTNKFYEAIAEVPETLRRLEQGGL